MLARSGARVINVDPLADSRFHVQAPEKLHAVLNRAFDTKVELRRSSLANAAIEDASVDRVYCISTIEHLEENEIVSTLEDVHRILKRGGLFIATVDLFLDIQPFASATHNKWGTNVSVHWIQEQSGLSLLFGKTSELCGYPDFDTDKILCNLDSYLLSSQYPVLTQMFILQKL